MKGNSNNLRKITWLVFLLCCSVKGVFSQTVTIPHSTYIFNCPLSPSLNPIPEKGQKSDRTAPRFNGYMIIQNHKKLAELTTCDQSYQFDFDKNIIVGIDGHTSGCNPGECFFEVVKDTSQKKYIVNFIKTITGNCRGAFAFRSFIQFEKPEKDFEVELKRVDTIIGFSRRPRDYFHLYGHVKQAETKSSVSAKITIQELDSPYNVYFASCNINSEGRYKISLPQSKKYSISVFQDNLHYLDYLDIDTVSKGTSSLKGPAGIVEKNIELKPIKKEDKIILSTISFEIGKHILKPESYSELNMLYTLLSNNPKLKVEISGHVNTIGNEVFNLELSKKRAKAVGDYLIKKGIASTRIVTVGYGDTQPITEKTKDDFKSRNRRIEFRVLED